MKKVLVVDDHEIVLMSFREIGESLEFSVTTAQSAQEALNLLETQEFDFAFIDVIMPGMNGIELTEKIFQKSPHPKITLMSGNVDASVIPKEMLAQIEFISKPFNVSKIEEILGIV